MRNARILTRSRRARDRFKNANAYLDHFYLRLFSFYARLCIKLDLSLRVCEYDAEIKVKLFGENLRRRKGIKGARARVRSFKNTHHHHWLQNFYCVLFNSVAKRRSSLYRRVFTTEFVSSNSPRSPSTSVRSPRRGPRLGKTPRRLLLLRRQTSTARLPSRSFYPPRLTLLALTPCNRKVLNPLRRRCRKNQTLINRTRSNRTQTLGFSPPVSIVRIELGFRRKT